MQVRSELHHSGFFLCSALHGLRSPTSTTRRPLASTAPTAASPSGKGESGGFLPHMRDRCIHARRVPASQWCWGGSGAELTVGSAVSVSLSPPSRNGSPNHQPEPPPPIADVSHTSELMLGVRMACGSEGGLRGEGGGLGAVLGALLARMLLGFNILRNSSFWFLMVLNSQRGWR